MLLILLYILVFLFVIYDVNYFLRTYFTVLIGRLYQRYYGINEITCIYGIGTFQDCDLSFRHLRLARVIRELDFARYHFYDRTGIYRRSKKLRIRSLQGSTLVVDWNQVPLFLPYKITSKLVYWDERSLFLKHELITILDGRVRALLISRQYALGATGDPAVSLLRALPGYDTRPHCEDYIRLWLDSMRISSIKLTSTKK